jgi:spectinomycin phosphotransferase
MLDRPELNDETIAGALDAGYGLRVREVDFLPIGNDPASWAFAVHARDGERYFLKLRAGPHGARGAAVPHHLHRLRVPHVLSPMTTVTGAP